MRQLGRFRLEIAFAVFEPKFSKPKTTLKTSFCHFRPKNPSVPHFRAQNYGLNQAYPDFEPKNALTKKDASLTEASRYKVQLLQRSVHLFF